MIKEIFGWPIYIGKMKNHKKIKEAMEPILNDPKYFHKPEDWRCDVDSTYDLNLNNSIDYSLYTDEVVNTHLKNYLKNFNPINDHNIIFNSWMNRYRPGQYQEQHSHISHSAHFSCTYFMTMPKDGGQFVYVDPSFDYLMSFGFYKWYKNTYTRNYIPEQEEGTVIIFPSNLEHFVTQNNSNSDRVTISGNFTITDQDFV